MMTIIRSSKLLILYVHTHSLLIIISELYQLVSYLHYVALVVIVAPSPTISSSVISVTPNVTAENPDSQSDGLSGGEIAAIVIGSVLGAALVLTIIVVTALWYAV